MVCWELWLLPWRLPLLRGFVFLLPSERKVLPSAAD
jgi:hypothetical protein